MITPFIERTVSKAAQMLEQGISKQKILAYLVNAAEAMAGDGAVSSILLLDEKGLLRNGCSPQLPYDYINAIDGLRPDAGVGTCAAAAATGMHVITEDFQADNKWAELRQLPMSLGFVGAWRACLLRVTTAKCSAHSALISVSIAAHLQKK